MLTLFRVWLSNEKSAKAMRYSSSKTLVEHTADLSTKPAVVLTLILFRLQLANLPSHWYLDRFGCVR
jgi:hypothetical protein